MLRDFYHATLREPTRYDETGLLFLASLRAWQSTDGEARDNGRSGGWLILIPILILIFASMAFMAADAARWQWSNMPPSIQWAGAVPLLLAIAFMYWVMRTNSYAAPVVKIQKERGQTVITAGPYRIVRHPLYLGALFYFAATSLVLGSWWGLAAVPVVGLALAIRIGVEEKALREGLQGYDDYACRVRWRLIPFIW